MEELIRYKREAIMIAGELGYPDLVINKINEAANSTQVANIMIDARRKYL